MSVIIKIGPQPLITAAEFVGSSVVSKNIGLLFTPAFEYLWEIRWTQRQINLSVKTQIGPRNSLSCLLEQSTEDWWVCVDVHTDTSLGY